MSIGLAFVEVDSHLTLPSMLAATRAVMAARRRAVAMPWSASAFLPVLDQSTSQVLASGMRWNSSSAGRKKALDAALATIEIAFGKGTIMKLGAAEVNNSIETIPTGSLSLDLALGIGGLPRGYVERA